MEPEICVRYLDLRNSFNKMPKYFSLSDVPADEIAKWKHGDGVILKLTDETIIDFCYWDNQITGLKAYWS